MAKRKEEEILKEVDTLSVELAEAVLGTESEQRAQKLNNLIQNCLKEYSGTESNIPINHKYWEWQNELKGILGAFK